MSTASRRLPAHVRFPLQRDGVDPVPRLEESRAHGDVVRLTRLLGTRVWLVMEYDAARAVLADSDAFANDVRHLIGRQDRAPAERIGGLGMTDAPDHDRLRHVLTPYFTRRRLATCSPRSTGSSRTRSTTWPRTVQRSTSSSGSASRCPSA